MPLILLIYRLCIYKVYTNIKISEKVKLVTFRNILFLIAIIAKNLFLYLYRENRENYAR